MVAGPFMQGMLLVGVIYWYSKGLINLINDYYRVEFNRKLKSEISEQKIPPLQTQTYDLDDMDQLINIERDKEVTGREENENALDVNVNSCSRLNGKREFLNIIFSVNCNYYKMYPMCWLNEDHARNCYSNSNLYSDIRIFEYKYEIG